MSKMREIKFRVWDKVGSEMIQQDDMFELYDVEELFEKPSDEQYELMQFTGLKDKNGKEIYEGDVVNSKAHNPQNYLVAFIDCAFHCTHPKIEPYTIEPLHFYTSIGCHLEVIGNIYENPELLEEK